MSPPAFARLSALAFLSLVCAKPSQVFVNWGNSSSEAVVTWTDSDVDAERDLVQWSLTPDFAAPVSSGPAQLLNYATPPGGKGIFGPLPAYTSGVIHRAPLAALPTGAATVHYRIGSTIEGWKFISSFRSHPGVGANVPVRLLVLADHDVDCYVEKTGKVCNPQAVLASATAPALQASINAGAIILGDLAYSNGNQSHWDLWQEFYSPLSSTMAVMTNAGNHEQEKGVGDDSFISFKTRFGGMPYCEGCADSGALFYSYEVGPLHVLALSAYEDLSPESLQTRFLEADLAAVNRTRTPWVLTCWHPPVYNSNKKHYMEHEAFRLAYEPLLLAARVNIAMTGHVHGFQRTKQVANNEVVQAGGIYHWMVGMGGKELYRDWREPLTDYPWVAARDATFWGYSVLTVHNATTACVDVICSAGDTCADGDIVDSACFENQLIALGEMPASFAV